MRMEARWIRGLAVAMVSTFLVVGGAFAADGLIRSGGSDDGTRVVDVMTRRRDRRTGRTGRVGGDHGAHGDRRAERDRRAQRDGRARRSGRDGRADRRRSRRPSTRTARPRTPTTTTAARAATTAPRTRTTTRATTRTTTPTRTTASDHDGADRRRTTTTVATAATRAAATTRSTPTRPKRPGGRSMSPDGSTRPEAHLGRVDRPRPMADQTLTRGGRHQQSRHVPPDRSAELAGDRATVEAVLAGDRDAFRVLVEREGPRSSGPATGSSATSTTPRMPRRRHS